mmetsp:Transcript_19898/g.55974  ORF Transcript_19898/g.55974 Transcript_19898/m.55974 type:complete len:232 (+) Transcript_19898:35-730(+)
MSLQGRGVACQCPLLPPVALHRRHVIQWTLDCIEREVMACALTLLHEERSLHAPREVDDVVPVGRGDDVDALHRERLVGHDLLHLVRLLEVEPQRRGDGGVDLVPPAVDDLGVELDAGLYEHDPRHEPVLLVARDLAVQLPLAAGGVLEGRHLLAGLAERERALDPGLAPDDAHRAVLQPLEDEVRVEVRVGGLVRRLPPGEAGPPVPRLAELPEGLVRGLLLCRGLHCGR